jgi:hypothetical protein
MTSLWSPPVAKDFNFSGSIPSTGKINFPNEPHEPLDLPFEFIGIGIISFGLSSSQHDFALQVSSFGGVTICGIPGFVGGIGSGFGGIGSGLGGVTGGFGGVIGGFGGVIGGFDGITGVFVTKMSTTCFGGDFVVVVVVKGGLIAGGSLITTFGVDGEAVRLKLSPRHPSGKK